VLTSIREKLTSQFEGLVLHDRVYKVGAFAFGIYIVIGMICGVLFGQDAISKVANIFVYFIATIFTIAVFIEYWFAIKPLLEKTWVKWSGAGLGYLVYRYSEGKAADFVNEFTELDPNKLPDALSLLAALFLPYSWLVLVSAIIAAYLIVIWFIAPFNLKKDQQTVGEWKFIGRFVGVFTIFIILQQLISAFDEKDSLIALISKETVLRTEYFKSTACKNVPENSLVADIGRGYVSVFFPISQSFKVVKCQYKT